MTEEVYTDGDLLAQIEAESETAISLGMINHPSTVKVLLEGFIRKIEKQRNGIKWWEE